MPLIPYRWPLSDPLAAVCLQLTKRHRNGQLQQIDWLDRLTFREIEVINEREKRSSSALYLMIEFPKIVADKQEVRAGPGCGGTLSITLLSVKGSVIGGSGMGNNRSAIVLYSNS